MPHRRPNGKKTFLIITQVYVPDPTSVGQHLADAAVGLARRGFRVKVLTSRRGYDDVSRIYPSHSMTDGVEIRRLRFSSFGKRSLGMRLVGQFIFVAQATVLGMFTSKLAAVLISTSPPIVSLAGLPISVLRRVKLKYWAMDLNPDQAIAMGVVSPNGLTSRALDLLNRWTLRRSDVVVTLDDYMAGRLRRKAPIGDKMRVIPPWPHNSPALTSPADSAEFRRRHGLDGKFVVMYSGNHSPAHPITTLLDAARELADDDRIRFVFVGGGLSKAEVEEVAQSPHGRNVVSLPYQPLSSLGDSLGSADVHVVTMGDNMVGCVHPTKVYGALAAGKPVLFIGPRSSHVGRLLTEHDVGWLFDHGEHVQLAGRIKKLADSPPLALMEVGSRGARVITEELSRPKLERDFLDAICASVSQS